MPENQPSSAPGGSNATLKPVTPTPFPYFLAWNRLGRKGQACKITANNQKTCSVEFEDGFFYIFDRRAIRLRR